MNSFTIDLIEWVLSLLFLNIMIHFPHRVADKKLFQLLFVLLLSTLCSLCALGITLMFSFSNNVSYFLIILVSTLSFVNLCVVNRKYLGRTQYIFVFIILSITYIFVITMLFGEIYCFNPIPELVPYDESLETVSDYLNRLTPYLAAVDEYIAKSDIYLSYLERAYNCPYLAYFLAGFEKYFISPNPLSFSNPHFVQHLISLVINGTIIASIFDLIKSIIVPMPIKM